MGVSLGGAAPRSPQVSVGGAGRSKDFAAVAASKKHRKRAPAGREDQARFGRICGSGFFWRVWLPLIWRCLRLGATWVESKRHAHIYIYICMYVYTYIAHFGFDSRGPYQSEV